MTHHTHATAGVDYASTLFLPRTDFPMRGDLPNREPALLERWRATDLSGRLAAAGVGRPRFVVHDGPPYANGEPHLGHALNKTLKDVTCRSRRMTGRDARLVPGWDCHGLPVEWKVEEACRAEGRDKSGMDPVAFRRRCRAFASGWLGVQRDGFRRLGVEADWDRPYSTMDFRSEAAVAREAMAFARNGLLYRGRKPVMWSVAEGTALAEAEVEYADVTCVAAHVAFPCATVGGRGPGAMEWDALASGDGGVRPARAVCWTTTPWTLPANRAVAYSPSVPYGLYRVTAAERDGVVAGDRLVLADALAGDVLASVGAAAWERLGTVTHAALAAGLCAHPLAGAMDGYGFAVPLLPGDHVTDAAGTGLVHTAPAHGREDHDAWLAAARDLRDRGLSTSAPCVVGPDGAVTDDAPGFGGRRVMSPEGGPGDMDAAVLDALSRAGTLLARRRLRHPYPHSWRSRTPVLFRSTPQWFVAMDLRRDGGASPTLRETALAAAADVRWAPRAGLARMSSMLAGRPDWVVSRQRLWGTPLPLFVRDLPDGRTETLLDDAVDARVLAAFEAEGADAWFAPGARERFLGDRSAEPWDKVDDVLDVWFDSGATHAFVLGDPEAFPAFAGLRRAAEGGPDVVAYMEGTDQHRGWFQSSLLESCGTRGRAPYDMVLTHGFVLDGKGRKMAKSSGNGVSVADLVARHGADVLRLCLAMADHSDDVRFGPEALSTAGDAYRRLRNVLRWLLGALAHRPAGDAPPPAPPTLERVLLHRLAEVDGVVREAYEAFDFARVVSTLSAFVTADLSAVFFEARKDALYCEPRGSTTRLAALWALERTFERLACWLAPLLPFTAEEAWLSRHPSHDGSVHLLQFPPTPDGWRDDALAARWAVARDVRRVVTGALERARAAGMLGSPLEADPVVHVDAATMAALDGFDMAGLCVTSGLSLSVGEGPEGAFASDDVPGVAVEVRLASGRRCSRSRRYTGDVGSVPGFPDVSARDARALSDARA